MKKGQTFLDFLAFVGIIVILTAMVILLVSALVKKAHAEMEQGQCEELVNSIFEIDQAGKLNPPLDSAQILELNNACDSQMITEDDIKQMAPQYWEPSAGVDNWVYEKILKKDKEDKDE